MAAKMAVTEEPFATAVQRDIVFFLLFPALIVEAQWSLFRPALHYLLCSRASHFLFDLFNKDRFRVFNIMPAFTSFIQSLER